MVRGNEGKGDTRLITLSPWRKRCAHGVVSWPGKVVKHTLPHFVPLDEAKRHLEKDMTQFFREVSDYLNAFVTRRQQVTTPPATSQPPASLGLATPPLTLDAYNPPSPSPPLRRHLPPLCRHLPSSLLRVFVGSWWNCSHSIQQPWVGRLKPALELTIFASRPHVRAFGLRPCHLPPTLSPGCSSPRPE